MDKRKAFLLLAALAVASGTAAAEKHVIVPKAEEVVIPAAEPVLKETPVSLGVQIPWTPAPEAAASPEPEETPVPEAAPSAQPRVLKHYTKAELDAAGVGLRILMRGMEGDDVMMVQQRLTELGYLWGEADGKYGRLTEKAVKDFQRKNGLEKVDGKAGEMTFSLLFSEDVLVQPTPTPSPTPTPVPTPTPTPSPTPAPVSTAEPDASKAPFSAERSEVRIGGYPVELLLGKAEGVSLYPLCGVFMHKGYDCVHADGTWVLTGPAGQSVTVMADAKDGAFDGALGALGKELLMAEDTVYVFGDDLWVSAAFLRQLGLQVDESVNPVQIL